MSARRSLVIKAALDWVNANEKKVRPAENMAAGQLDALDYREQVPASARASTALLPHDSSLNRTASWVLRNKETKEVIAETFNPRLVERLNTEKYEAVPIGQYLGEINGQPRRAVNATPAISEPVVEGRALAETRIAKPDNYKALTDQYRVDPETGDFPELADIDNLRAEGRLTADDIAELDAASATVDDAKAYGEALKTVVGCIL